jgi:beta-xylosidase
MIVYMKNLFLFLLILLAGCAEEIKYSGNPLFDGWYADPEVIILNNKYWIFPTFSVPYEKQTFLDAFSSDDLVSWEKHNRITDTAAVKWARYAMWAPAVIEKDNKYFLFFGANDIQSDNEHGGIGIAVANDPGGPFSDYLGKPLIDKFHNGAQPIDQFVFKNTDGRHYLIYGGWRHCNIALLKDDFSGIEPMPDSTLFKEITPEGYVEGPFMFIRDGKYYFMWSEGGWGGPDYRVAYAISDNLTGPFKRAGVILQQNPAVATGAGHHSVMNIPGTEKWYIVYHRRPLDQTDANSRVVCIDKLEFDDDGSIKPVIITNTGVALQKLKK